MKCIVVKMFADSDWWRIERAEHDGREWMEEKPSSWGGGTVGYYCLSCRLEPYTCVEGPGWEMRALADAIMAGGSEDFKRCAVETTPDGVLVWSPRNSNDRRVLISHDEARELAADIRQKVPPCTD